jgi:hypothetical protein
MHGSMNMKFSVDHLIREYGGLFFALIVGCNEHISDVGIMDAFKTSRELEMSVG